MKIDDLMARYEAKFKQPPKRDGHWTDHFVMMMADLLEYQERETHKWQAAKQYFNDFFDNPKKQEQGSESTMD